MNSASVLSVDMTATTADQISVTGAVNITSASLQLSIPINAGLPLGILTLINNDLADAISERSPTLQPAPIQSTVTYGSSPTLVAAATIS